MYLFCAPCPLPLSPPRPPSPTPRASPTALTTPPPRHTRRAALLTFLSLPLAFPTLSLSARPTRAARPPSSPLSPAPPGAPPAREVAAPPSPPPPPPPPLPTVTLDLGVKAQEISAGVGDAYVQEGALVSVKYVMRRSNGYFIDASYGFDRFDTFTFRAGSTDVVRGFDAGVRGMRQAGRRRFVVPPDVGYVGGVGTGKPGPLPPDFGARRSLVAHAKEPIVFEVQVVRIRE